MRLKFVSLLVDDQEKAMKFYPDCVKSPVLQGGDG